MTKLVYIGGDHHSGSALLEDLLAASPQIVACGEIARVPGERNRNGKCSCGRSARDCLLWGPLLGSPKAVFAQSHDRLLLALRERVKGRYAAVVDSSKTDWRSMAAPFRFRSAMGSDFLLVHLVRHPCGVAWSAVTAAKREDKRPLSLLRAGVAAFGWSVANLTCELFRRSHGRAYRRLRYEDLAHAPDTVMRDLLAALLPEAEWRAANIGISRENRHQLWGRLCGSPLTLADIKEDEDWKRDMPKLHRAVVRAITFPLRKRYRYE